MFHKLLRTLQMFEKCSEHYKCSCPETLQQFQKNLYGSMIPNRSQFASTAELKMVKRFFIVL
jgi:hypothetical protein